MIRPVKYPFYSQKQTLAEQALPALWRIVPPTGLLAKGIKSSGMSTSVCRGLPLLNQNRRLTNVGPLFDLTGKEFANVAAGDRSRSP